MAAEILTKHFKLDFYRPALLAVVSKYIGETEKNLPHMFDEAEDGGGILFFDEANALFGKRSKVKDNRDRYAHTEINYLLQRVEEYGVVIILASNMSKNIEYAFLHNHGTSFACRAFRRLLSHNEQRERKRGNFPRRSGPEDVLGYP